MLNVVAGGTEPLFDLAEAKAHLRVDTAGEDALIETYSNAAVARVLGYCNIDLIPVGPLPEAAFKAAALLVLGDLYANREPVLTEGAPVANMIELYRNLRV